MLCKGVNIVSSKRAQVIMYGKFFFYGLHFSTRKADRLHRTWTQKYRTGFACEGEVEGRGVLMQPPPEEGISVSPHFLQHASLQISFCVKQEG